MVILIEYIMVVSLLAAFIICLLKKWRVVEYLQVHGNDFFSKMAGCDFCLSWWACVVISMACAIIICDPIAILAPFCSTPLTRMLL